MSEFSDLAWGVYQRGAENSTARDYSVGTTSSVCALPEEWGPRGTYWLHLTALSRVCYYLFSDQVDAVVAVPGAGSATGVGSLQIGGVLQPGVREPVVVPSGCRYFARITDGSGTDVIVAELRSNPRIGSVG